MKVLRYVLVVVFAMMMVGLTTATTQAAPTPVAASSSTAADMAAVTANPDSFVVPDVVLTEAFCTQLGGAIYNHPDSYWAIGVYSGCANNGVRQGTWSYSVSATKDVDFFYVGVYAYCRNIDTGYIYTGGTGPGTTPKRYTMASDSVRLRLKCLPVGY